MAESTTLEIIIAGRDQFSGTANRVVGSLNRIQGAAGRVGRGVGQVGLGLARLGVIAGTAAAAGLAVAAKAAIDYEDAFAGVRKTVQATPAELDRLSAGFRKLATEIPISANTLASLGETAGALGVPTRNIEEFVRITALLGVTTNLSAEQAADSLGRIGNVLGLTSAEYERFASSLVALGNAGASTETEIIAMAERAGAAGKLIGLTAAQILAYSSAVASLNIEPEAGGSSLQKFFIETAKTVADGGKGLAMYSKVAGTSAAEFRRAWGKDPNSALTQFLVGLGKLDQAAQLNVLDKLGLDDIRITRTLLGLANNTKLLTDQQGVAAQGWKENSALSEEARKRFETLASQIGILRNNLIEAAITVGEGFTPALARAVAKLTAFVASNKAELKAFGEEIGRALEGIDWDEVASGAKAVASALQAIFTWANKLPTEVKAAAIALGALTSIPGISGATGLIAQGAGNIIGGLGGALTRGLAVKLPGVGSLFAQPVYVTNFPPGFGGLGGATGAGAAGAGIGALGALLGVGTVVGLGALSAGTAMAANAELAAKGLTEREIRALKWSQMSADERFMAERRGFGEQANQAALAAAAAAKLAGTPTPGRDYTTPATLGAQRAADTQAQAAYLQYRAAERASENVSRQELHNKLRLTPEQLKDWTTGKASIENVEAAQRLLRFFQTSLSPSTKSLTGNIENLEGQRASFLAQGDKGSAAAVSKVIDGLEAIRDRQTQTNELLAASALSGMGGLSPDERDALRNPPSVDVDVDVYVTPRQMQSSSTTQTRYGPSTGSLGRGPRWDKGT